MPASRYDFSIEQGSSFRMSLVYKDDLGNPINLTNYCARLTWTTSKGVVQTFTTLNIDYSTYKFTIEPVIGKITLLIPSSVTNGFTFETAKYDLELQSGDNLYVGGGRYTTRLIYGTITILQRYSGNDTALVCA